MKTSEFDFHLPQDCIARYPLPQRRDSRCLRVDRETGAMQDGQFTDVLQQLRPGDCLVLNDTKVIPARWHGRKMSGGQVECFIERITAESPYPRALVHMKASKAPKLGSDILLNGDISATLLARSASGLIEVQFNTELELFDLLEQFAEIPLPPYVDRTPTEADKQRYQTVFAEQPGAVAAPTAGLHFDQESLQALAGAGVNITKLTLHVGAGTFQPVRVEHIADHQMHSERYEVSAQSCDLINTTRAQGGRIIAVGTTVVRTLETLARLKGQTGDALQPHSGMSQIFITPGFEFAIVDAMITNFHLPKSSLLMLVSAFAGRENILRAYQHAIEQGYRFYSYGDAMFIA